MPNLTVTIPEELKKKMESLPEINWSESIREYLSKKVARAAILRKLDKMLENSELTEDKCLKLGEKAKIAMLKRYKTEGW